MADCGPLLDLDGVIKKLQVKKKKTILGYSSFECCPWAEFSRPYPWKLAKWKLWEAVNTALPTCDELDKVLPICELDKKKISNPPHDKVQVTWIGHATMLVQFDGITILTDPVFGKYCGPSHFLIPNGMNYERYREASCQVKDIENLDAVVISHNHYDHLETEAVKAINEKFPNITWFVASGQRSWMGDKGVDPSHVVELEWWQKHTSLVIGDKTFSFICTPTQHWCQRGPHDFNTALWCGWVVKGPTKSFYFAGDTGYYKKLFETIGKKYGPFDLAGIPIGAYEPRYITEFQHVAPEESVKIHQDIKSKQSIGIHWGTFELTNEFFVEPPQKVEDEMKNCHLDPSEFFCINHGETWCTGEEYKERQFMRYKRGTSEVTEKVKKQNKVDTAEEAVEG